MCDFNQSKSNTDSGDKTPLHFQLYPVAVFSVVLSVKPQNILNPSEGLEAKNIPFCNQRPMTYNHSVKLL